MSQPRWRIVATLTASACLLFAVPAGAAVSDAQRARRGSGYAASLQEPSGAIVAFSPIGSTADAVLAFVAADAQASARRSAVGYLRGQVKAGNVTGVGLVAKVVHAVAAVGKDPRDFGGTNLVRWLRSRIRESGRIGNATVFDHALAVIALEASGVRPSGSVTDWLLAAQCPVGGWSYDAPYDPSTDDESCHDGSADDFFTADTNTTAYAVMALEYADRADHVHDPFAFLESARDAVHDGWEYAPGFGTDANSTALAIQAYLSAGLEVPADGLEALRALQPDVTLGAWAYAYDGDEPGDPNLGATIGAVPAIAQVTFPLVPASPLRVRA
jgi:hypothetical protein